MFGFNDGGSDTSANAIVPVISSANSTTTPLSGGATFTGDWDDILNYASISIIGEADEIGTLFADFSIDGVTVDRTLQLSSGSTSSFDIQSLIKITRYFRVRVVNGATPQTTFRLQTIYDPNARIAIPTSRANQGLNDYVPVLNVRSILSDDTGSNNAIVTDHQALQVTSPPEGKTAFGEALTSRLTPVAELQFSTFINTDLVDLKQNQSGTVTHENNMSKISTGASSNSSAELESFKNVRYLPGVGVRTRFTAIFTTGVANSTQYIGIGNSGDGFYFGYNGADFGILHRRYGTPEVRTLTITTASTTDEDITITLDGDADSTVTVTNSGNITTTANEIASHDYSDVGRGWSAYVESDTVIFVSWTSEPRSGSYSLSGATTAVGTFAQTIAGITPTETFIDQADWNQDKFDGTGLTGVTLDPTKGNVFQIVYQWLGFGAIYFYIEDPDDGELHLCHIIEYANANTRPSLGQPSMPLTAIAENTSNTTDIILRTGSLSAFQDGEAELIGTRLGAEEGIVLGATAVETPIMSLRIAKVFKNAINRGEVKVLLAGASVEHSKPVAIKFYKNATLTDASFSSIGTNSMVQKDSSATAFSGGTFLFAIQLGKTGNAILNTESDPFALRLSPADVLTATIAPSSGNQAEGNVSFNFVELY